ARNTHDFPDGKETGVSIRKLTIAAAGLVLALAAGACGNDDGNDGGSRSSDPLGVDDGTELTMWTRSATETQSQLLVDAYNATHKNQVKLTVFPVDEYLGRVGTAAGAQELPDLVSLDVVFVPQFTTAGALLDITE